MALPLYVKGAVLAAGKFCRELLREGQKCSVFIPQKLMIVTQAISRAAAFGLKAPPAAFSWGVREMNLPLNRARW